MRGNHQHIASSVRFEEFSTGRYRELPGDRRDAFPLELGALHGMVHQVSSENGAAAGGGYAQRDLTGSVTVDRLDAGFVVKLVWRLDQQHASRIDQRTHAGGDRSVAEIPVRFLALAPVVPLAARKDIFRVRESRYELAVVPVGVPPGVIEMEMSAEHEVDVLRFHARCAKLLEIGNRRKIVGSRTLLSAGAEAGVNKDQVARRPHQQALDAENHCRVRGQSPSIEPATMRLHSGVCQFRSGFTVAEERGERHHRPFSLDDPGDFDIADMKRWRTRGYRASARTLEARHTRAAGSG